MPLINALINVSVCGCVNCYKQLYAKTVDAPLLYAGEACHRGQYRISLSSGL